MATATTKTATPPPPPPPPPPPSPSSEENEKSIVEVLSYPISLLEPIRKVVKEAELFKADCNEVEKVTENIVEMLCSAVRIATVTSPGSLYERPIRKIVAVVSRNFEEALTLVTMYRRRSVLRRVMTAVSSADFRKLLYLLKDSLADMKWLLSIFDGGGGTMFSLSPITRGNPVLSWIWAYIAILYMGQITEKVEAANQDKDEAANQDKIEAANRDKVEAANLLALLAKDNDSNKKIIVKEGGVPPLLKLLKDASSVDVKIASASTLLYLANDEERVYSIIYELGVSIIVQVLGDSPIELQIKLANLVARMAEHSSVAKEDFARENVIKPLVTLLSRDVFADESNFQIAKHGFHSIVQINKEPGRNQLHREFGSWFSVHDEEEDPEVKLRLKLKISCAEALGMLARGSVLISRRITETKGLLCLAKLVEKGKGELLFECLRAIMEITAAAETNSDLRRAAFKTNSPAAKAVVDQLLKVITDCNSPTLHILAIKSIGSLARTFTAREARVISPLVQQLWPKSCDVAAEAVIALEKFASPDNFLCMEHSKRIIELKGLEPLLELLRRVNEQTSLHSLTLLCYLVLHARNIKAQELPRVLNILEAAGAQHPELRDLTKIAVLHLKVYHSGLSVQRHQAVVQKCGDL